MSKSFNKFKRRVRAQAIASAVLWGLAVGLLAFSILTLIAKLLGNELDPIYYAVVGGGAALVSLALYFILMPSDIRLAKRLDALYSLDEKVATMVVLKDKDDPFVLLQREDADEKLGEKPRKQLKSKPLVAGLIVLFIAIGSVVGAWLMPVKAEAGEAPIDEFDKQWLIAAIGELITTVENAYIDDGLRQDTLVELRSLLAFVEDSELLSEMKTEAIRTVIAINRALVTANSAEAIGKQMLSSSTAEMAELGAALTELSGTNSKKALQALGSAASAGGASDATFIADELDTYLQHSGVRSDEALYMLFKGLVSTLKTDHGEAEDEFDKASKTLGSAVVVQNVNKTTVNVVITKLCNLFGITESDIAEVDPDADIVIRDPSQSEEMPDDSEVDEPEGDMGSGGLGTGEVIYGSNDLIFDPYTNTYRPYGEVLNDYFVKANEQITDGKTSDEISDAVEEYFDILFGGSNND